MGIIKEGMVENMTGAKDNEDTFVFAEGGSLRGVVEGGVGGFDSVVYDVSTDLANTASLAVGDVDGDGDLDLVAGNGLFGNQPNRAFVNWCEDAGGCLTDENVFDRSDVHEDYEPDFYPVGAVTDLFNTQDIALGDLDEDGEIVGMF